MSTSFEQGGRSIFGETHESEMERREAAKETFLDSVSETLTSHGNSIVMRSVLDARLVVGGDTIADTKRLERGAFSLRFGTTQSGVSRGKDGELSYGIPITLYLPDMRANVGLGVHDPGNKGFLAAHAANPTLLDKGAVMKGIKEEAQSYEQAVELAVNEGISSEARAEVGIYVLEEHLANITQFRDNKEHELANPGSESDKQYLTGLRDGYNAEIEDTEKLIQSLRSGEAGTSAKLGLVGRKGSYSLRLKIVKEAVGK